MMRPAPTCPREFFTLFESYTPDKGLDGLMQEIDPSSVEPRHIYFALHARAPERRQFAIAGADFVPADRFARAFRSDEFRRNIIPRFLEAFPEKRRLLFIHIPKTAGSELSARFMQHFPHLSSQELAPGWGDDETICRALKDAVTRLRQSDSLFVCGHNTLERYRNWRAMRFPDQVFALLREPRQAVISQVNYVLMRIFAREQPARPDTLGWRRTFRVENPDPNIGKAALVELAGRILRASGVVRPHVACQFLGGATADEAIDKVISYDIELVDTSRMDQWCLERWGMDRQARSNVSPPYVEMKDLSRSDLEHLDAITQQDGALYAKVQEAMGRLGTNSVKGRDLA
jgi:hypothetical protein